ncbi:MAG TPA: hypothetical protein VMV79_01610, partial [Alphaproteobacteria bacterium]|nr:hypothetical protein [Alphaproteobacteria bacterium]
YGAATDHAALAGEAEKLRAAITGCTNLDSRVAAQFPGWIWQDLGTVKLSQVPPWLADKARTLPVGKPSAAMATDKGALILFVCARKMPESKINREAIVDQIGTEKLALQARSLLGNLRRQAYIDVRLTGVQ